MIKSATVEWDGKEALAPAPGKSCGSCTACCEIVPVEELKLAAFKRCPHMVWHRGCSIYNIRPHSCRLWSCGWLIGDLPDKYRPDKIGIICDPVPDLIRINDEEHVAAQFWVLPGHENDWKRSAAAQRLIIARLNTGMCVLWRTRDPKTGDQIAMVLGKSPDGSYWYSEHGSGVKFDNSSNVDRLLRAQHLLRAAP